MDGWLQRVLNTIRGGSAQASRAADALRQTTATGFQSHYPNTYFPPPGEDGVARADVFDPALKHFSRAFRRGDPAFASDEQRTTWLAVRREMMYGAVAAVANLPIREHLVLRGSLLMHAWFGAEAREPGDIDWVVQPPGMKVDEPRAAELMSEVATAVVRHPAPAGVEILRDRIATDDIWSYERAPGKRLVIPWRCEGIPDGVIQMDFVFNEDLLGEAFEETLASPRGETIRVFCASPGLSLAWKILWLESDSYPQGKDLYDAALLTHRATLSRDGLDLVLGTYEPNGFRRSGDIAPAEWRVDWEGFRQDYGWTEEQARVWLQRVAAYLERVVRDGVGRPID